MTSAQGYLFLPLVASSGVLFAAHKIISSVNTAKKLAIFVFLGCTLQGYLDNFIVMQSAALTQKFSASSANHFGVATPLIVKGVVV